jgi:hypothetical protein
MATCTIECVTTIAIELRSRGNVTREREREEYTPNLLCRRALSVRKVCKVWRLLGLCGEIMNREALGEK